MTEDALKAEKLRAEIRKLTAEAEKEEATVRSYLRDEQIATAKDWWECVYQFCGAVTSTSTQACIETLSKWQRIHADDDRPFTIVLNSPGGSVIDGLALWDHIADLKAQGRKFITVTRGMAASMGGILLQAGDERVVGPASHVLIHEISTGTSGRMSDIEDEMEFCKSLADRCLDILAERSTMSKAAIKRKWLRRDWWLSADESVKLGFADRIG